jgi:cytochrome c556
MKTAGLFAGLTMAALVACSTASPSPPQAITSLREMMLKIVQPNSDAVFYISRTPPQSDGEWQALEAKTLILAESANLLMLPGYARDQQQWFEEARLMRTAARTAYEASREKNLGRLEELNNELYTSCESCHEAYR